MPDYETYDLGDFTLQSGEVIPSAKIAYKTFGDPSLPAIIYPTWYSGRTLFFPFCFTHPHDFLLTQKLTHLTQNRSNLRQRMAHQSLQNPLPIHLLHHHPCFIRKLRVFLSLQHFPQSLPQSNFLRQCNRSIHLGNQTLAHHPRLCSIGLVHGRSTNLPMGNPISRLYG